MSGCDFSKPLLMAWLDGEAGKRTAEIREHLEHCRDCANEVDSWRQAGEELRQLVDGGVGEVEPLVALRRIRERVEAAESRTVGARLRSWWDDVLTYNRRALAGVAAAAALGALVAPGMFYWLGSNNQASLSGPTTAAVVVESMEVGGNATAVVLGADNGSTTLIWVEPDADATPHEETL